MNNWLVASFYGSRVVQHKHFGRERASRSRLQLRIQQDHALAHVSSFQLPILLVMTTNHLNSKGSGLARSDLIDGYRLRVNALDLHS